MANLSAERSPSGLFRMATWEGDMERSHAQMPRWYWNRAERYRQFVRWVEAEAEGMAMHLARHLRPDTPPETAGAVGPLVDLLSSDAAWARRCAEQSVERAA